jgi:hypothetical protein
MRGHMDVKLRFRLVIWRLVIFKGQNFELLKNLVKKVGLSDVWNLII